MFASPVRPRTMTKEWQEATEEYLKVRSSFVFILHSVHGILRSLTRHRLKDLSPLPVTRACTLSQSRRRSLEWTERPATSRESNLRALQLTHQTNTYTTFPWVNFPFGTTCVHNTTRLGGLRAAWPTVILVLSVQNSRGICAFYPTISSSPSMPARHGCTPRPAFSNPCTLLSAYRNAQLQSLGFDQ